MINMERKLEQEWVVVTGAGSGIGQQVAIGLAAQGANVILIGRRASKLAETQARIEEKGGKAYPIVADVGNPQDVERMAHQVVSEYGVPSLILNGAGVHGEMKAIAHSNPQQWIDTFMINTVGAYLVCRAFMGDMVKANRWGRIINISSAAALHPPSGVNSAYGTSKAALNHFTRQLATELTGTGVTANAIHPGEVKTEMWAAIRDDAMASGEKNMLSWVELVERTGGDAPEKTVKLIMDLLKPESDSINGSFLWIEDGIQEPLPSWDALPATEGVWLETE